MFKLKTIINKSIYPLREEQKEVMERYKRACSIMGDIIDADIRVKLEDAQQHKVDMNRILWEEVYKPYYEELGRIIKMIKESYAA